MAEACLSVSLWLPPPAWGLIDCCRVQILPWVRYIRPQRSKYHYETHPRVPQFRKDQNTSGALEKISSCAVQAETEETFSFFFWTDNSTPTVTNPSSANLETQKIQGEEVKGEKKKKRSPALKSSRREGSLKRDRPLLQLLLDSHSPFEDVNISASLWKQLAACVFLQSFCGDFLSRKHLSEPSDYRAAQLSARPVGLIT